MEEDLISDEWRDCYREGWGKILCPEAYRHPAKFSRSLIQRIYQHLKAEEWIFPGAIIIDCFGGVALGAHDAILMGCHWIGVEVEHDFVSLGELNIARWQYVYRNLLGIGTAVLLQGDSQRLCEIIGQRCEVICSSPPYLVDQFGGGGNKHDKVIDAMKAGYGQTHGQLEQMKEGRLADIICTSPPFMQQQKGSGLAKPDAVYSGNGSRFGANHGYQNQGESAGNLSAAVPVNFWSASQRIVQQCYDLLTPGGVACFVLKAFVRKGKIVDFPGQWQQLCKSVGFHILHEHHALLTEKWDVDTLFDGTVRKEKKRVSFFRRLHEKRNPETAIDFEVVLCMIRPYPPGDVYETKERGQIASDNCD